MKGSVGLLAGTLSWLAFLFLARSGKIQFGSAFGSERSEQLLAKVCFGIFAFISTYMIVALLFYAFSR